jgi:predicted alpha/beta-hydrolase family hydrolase
MTSPERLEKPGIRGWLHQPEKVKAAMLLSHGAGGDCKNPLMVAVAKAFCDAGYLVLRWDLPFRQAGPRSSPGGSGKRDRDGIVVAVKLLRQLAPGVPLYLAGQSYGGRQSSMVAAEDPGLADGLLLLSYPLHPPGNPAQLRTEHFASLRVPSLFVHGTRDPFGSVEELREAIKLIPATARLQVVEGAGHGVPPATAASMPAWLSAGGK